MRKVKLQKREENKIIDQAVDYLLAGKIIACSTDTVYGLSCLANNARAVEKIYKIKNRSREKPLLVMVSSLDMAGKYFHINESQEKYLRAKWPGPNSFLLRGKRKLAPGLNINSDDLVVRLPKNDFLIKIIDKLKKPIVSTSLNRSGEEILAQVSDIEKYFKEEEIDLVVDAGILEGKPSQIMDLREGAEEGKIR